MIPTNDSTIHSSMSTTVLKNERLNKAENYLKVCEKHRASASSGLYILSCIQKTSKPVFVCI